MVCLEDSPDRLLAALGVNEVNLVISDSPVPSSFKIKAFNHLLGESNISFLAAKPLVKKYKKNFPHSLNGAPLLLPAENSSLRRSLNSWFDSKEVRPDIVGEFEDSALLNIFGQAGTGIFPIPSAVSGDLIRQFDVGIVGTTDEVKERYYAISVERKLKNPAVVAICDGAKQKLFG